VSAGDRVARRAGVSPFQELIIMKNLSRVIVASLALSVAAANAPVIAGGATPGSQLVAACEAELGAISDAFDATADQFATATIARLQALDEAGRTNEQLAAFVGQQLDRFERTFNRNVANVNRRAQRCMVRLVGFDEDGLITQITEVDDDRDAALDELLSDSNFAADQINTALDLIIIPPLP
jgi:hypothetical protein